MPPDSVSNDAQEVRQRQAMSVFYACLTYTVILTLIWLFLCITGKDGGIFFGKGQVSLKQVMGLVGGIVFFWMIWSYAFHWLKYGLLKRLGLSREELKMVFGNRLHAFDLEALLQRHSERSIRIIDMIGRRGRTIILVITSFGLVYLQIRQNPTSDSLLLGLQSSLFDAMFLNWWNLLTFHNNGVLGHMTYGAQARVLDGVLGRANALCIATLWSGFKFVMIPLAVPLSGIYSPKTYAVVYAFIWLSYAAADFASEIFGSLWGRHRIQVWGLGEINRKSWTGVVAGFICVLVLNVTLVYVHQLSVAWLVLGVLLAVTNPLIELISPRGTDDFTMATFNAALCLAYGWLVF